MALNPSIILAGQQPDFVNALARSNAAAAGANQMQDQNALRQLFATQGPQIAAGDQGAMNAFARLDPQAAMGMQQDQRQMQMREVEFNKQLEQFASQATAQQKAEAAARIEAGLKRGIAAYQSGNLQELNQILQAAGEEPISDVSQFPAIAARYEGVLETLGAVKDFNAPPKAADEYGRYVQEERAAGREPLSRIQFKKAGQKSSAIDIGPDGSVSIREGEQAQLPKTTEGEKSASGYLSRMKASEALMDSFGEDNVRSIASLVIGGTNFEGLLSDQQSKILQAQRDWVRAKLRKESGAVIGQDEMAEEIRTYFPLPGEGPEVIAQKRAARKEAERQMEIMSGAAAPQAERQPSERPDVDVNGAAPEFLNEQDMGLWDYMTTEERAAILGTYDQ